MSEDSKTAAFDRAECVLKEIVALSKPLVDYLRQNRKPIDAVIVTAESVRTVIDYGGATLE